MVVFAYIAWWNCIPQVAMFMSRPAFQIQLQPVLKSHMGRISATLTLMLNMGRVGVQSSLHCRNSLVRPDTWTLSFTEHLVMRSSRRVRRCPQGSLSVTSTEAQWYTIAHFACRPDSEWRQIKGCALLPRRRHPIPSGGPQVAVCGKLSFTGDLCV